MSDTTIEDLRDMELEEAVRELAKGKNLASVALTLSVVASAHAAYAGVPRDAYLRTVGFLYDGAQEYRKEQLT